MDAQAIIDNFRNVVFQHYNDFQGRVPRWTFWYYVLACAVIVVPLWTIGRITQSGLLAGAFILLELALLFPTLGISVRRLHDTNRSGWLVAMPYVPLLFFFLVYLSAIGRTSDSLFAAGWILLNLSPILVLLMFAGFVLLIYFWAQAGTVGPNQYGPDPQGGIAASEANQA